MNHVFCRSLAAAFVGSCLLAGSSLAADPIRLVHQFKVGDRMLIEVDHHGVVSVTEKEHTETYEHATKARRSYVIESIDANGWATVVSQVESVQMEATNEGGTETFDSRLPDEPADQFKNVAATVGIPLARFRVSPIGEIENVQTLLDGVTTSDASSQSHEHPFVRLPAGGVAIGDTWSESYKEIIKPPGDLPVKISMKRKYTLEAVAGGVATIGWKTIVLTPIQDSVLESELAQRKLNGKLAFAVKAGRLIWRDAKTEAQVVGFLGGGSLLECKIGRSEEMLTKTAAGYARPLR